MKTGFLLPLVFAFLALSPLAGAQDFMFYLPEEEMPAEDGRGAAGDVLVVEEIAPRDGFLTRLFRVLRGASVEDAEGRPAPDAFANGVVSRDPDDPDKKPRGTIFFSFNW